MNITKTNKQVNKYTKQQIQKIQKIQDQGIYCI